MKSIPTSPAISLVGKPQTSKSPILVASPKVTTPITTTKSVTPITSPKNVTPVTSPKVCYFN